MSTSPFLPCFSFEETEAAKLVDPLLPVDSTRSWYRNLASDGQRFRKRRWPCIRRRRTLPIAVAQEIDSEAKFQNDMLNQLQMALLKAQAGVKNNVRRLNKSIVHYGSSNVIHVVVFAFVCFFIVYM